MAFLNEIRNGKKGISSLRRAKTIVKDLSGRRYDDSTGLMEESNSPGFVVDTQPDPGLYACAPDLFIGSQDAAHNLKGMSVSKNSSGDEQEHHFPGLLNLGITHLVNAFSDERPFEHLGFKYLNVPLLDLPDVLLTSALEKSLAFVHSALSVGNGVGNPPSKVLVHCNAGISRSATIIIAYLIIHRGKSYEEALPAVRKNRPSAKPNSGFEAQLRNLDGQFRKDRSQGSKNLSSTKE